MCLYPLGCGQAFCASQQQPLDFSFRCHLFSRQFVISSGLIALRLHLEIAHCIPLSPQSVSSHLISSHVVSSQRFSPHLISSHLMSSLLVSSLLSWSQNITKYQIHTFYSCWSYPWRSCPTTKFKHKLQLRLLSLEHGITHFVRAWSDHGRDRLAPAPGKTFPGHLPRHVLCCKTYDFLHPLSLKHAFRARPPSKSQSWRYENEAFVWDVP